MNKTYQTEFRRVFLFRELPEPMTRADAHLQLFDNYIENTRLRLRYIRVPHTKEQTWILEHRIPADETNGGVWKTSEIFLNEEEYKIFETFEGREIRKNRYFLELEGKALALDVHLGDLRGLNVALVNFETEQEMRHFEAPPFALLEVTNDSFFYGENLVGKKFVDVQNEVQRLSETHQLILDVQDVQ